MDRSDSAVDLKAALTRVDLGSRRSSCPLHGDFEESGHRLDGLKRDLWSGCPKCSAAAAQERKAEAAKEAAARLDRERTRLIGQACIPARFQRHSFESFTADSPAQVHAATAVRDFVEQFDAHAERGGGLVLAGKPGTGKTHLAAAAMLELIAAGRWVQYLSCLDMIRLVRETWRRDSERTERDVLKLLGQRIDLLVIDEIGVQYGTDGEQTIVFEIIDRRYAEMRPTVLITNQDKQGFIGFVGERVADRLRQTHDWIPFDWPSYRSNARKEDAKKQAI